jgi:hypothetical protein
MAAFTCNICGAEISSCDEFAREDQSCPCGSTVRFRSIVHLLSLALFGRSISLIEFPTNKSIVGIGMSDWSGYAKSLALKFSYTNTFYSREPKLDITHPPAWTCDFLISSEVFEHVEPPVDRAFVGASRLVKPGGHLILSVPFVSGKTIEHYPNLATYKVVELGG